MDPRDLVLDGNAGAGMLYEIFGVEMTLGGTVCRNCGAENPIGRLTAYVHGMGMILRCPDCGAALIRAARTPGHYWIDLGGTRTLQVAEPAGHTAGRAVKREHRRGGPGRGVVTVAKKKKKKMKM